MSLKDKQVIFFVGPPGSGKDTQALYLADEDGMVQIPTSQIIRKKFAESPDDPEVIREKERFAQGFLTDPKFFAKLVLEFIAPLVEQGKSLVFSGSPRTPEESHVLLPKIVEMYGQGNVKLLYIQLDEAEARARIAGRRFCQANAHPIPATPEFAHMTVCPRDGSPLERRALDDADKQDKRFEAYYTLTEPCLKIVAEYGIPVITLDGSKTIEATHHDVMEIINRSRLPLN